MDTGKPTPKIAENKAQETLHFRYLKCLVIDHNLPTVTILRLSPGFCSPSMNLAFTDIPNGLKGAATVPLAGREGNRATGGL